MFGMKSNPRAVKRQGARARNRLEGGHRRVERVGTDTSGRRRPPRSRAGRAGAGEGSRRPPRESAAAERPRRGSPRRASGRDLGEDPPAKELAASSSPCASRGPPVANSTHATAAPARTPRPRTRGASPSRTHCAPRAASAAVAKAPRKAMRSLIPIAKSGSFATASDTTGKRAPTAAPSRPIDEDRPLLPPPREEAGERRTARGARRRTSPAPGIPPETCRGPRTRRRTAEGREGPAAAPRRAARSASTCAKTLARDAPARSCAAAPRGAEEEHGGRFRGSGRPRRGKGGGRAACAPRRTAASSKRKPDARARDAVEERLGVAGRQDQEECDDRDADGPPSRARARAAAIRASGAASGAAAGSERIPEEEDEVIAEGPADRAEERRAARRSRAPGRRGTRREGRGNIGAPSRTSTPARAGAGIRSTSRGAGRPAAGRRGAVRPRARTGSREGAARSSPRRGRPCARGSPGRRRRRACGVCTTAVPPPRREPTSGCDR